MSYIRTLTFLNSLEVDLVIVKAPDNLIYHNMTVFVGIPMAGDHEMP